MECKRRDVYDNARVSTREPKMKHEVMWMLSGHGHSP